MTYRSESRGLMYTAPPTGDDADRPDETKAETESEKDDATRSTTETPELGPTTSTTDANWTGTVPADD